MFSLSEKNPKLSPVFVIRVGLGLTFLYASLHMFMDPVAWLPFIPHWVGSIINPQTFLIIHSTFELIFAVLLLWGTFLPAVSLLAFLDFVSILIFYGVDDLTFRDFGLAMAALALFALVYDCTPKKDESK